MDMFYNSTGLGGTDLSEVNKTLRRSALNNFVTESWPKEVTSCKGVNIVYRGILRRVNVEKFVLAAVYSYEAGQEEDLRSTNSKLLRCINGTTVRHDTYEKNYNLISSVPKLKTDDGKEVPAYAVTFANNTRFCCEARNSCCPEGSTFVRSGESSYCGCNPGHYYERINQSTCHPCPKGTYQPKSGATNCELCPEGMTTVAEGSTGAASCAGVSECEQQVTWEVEGIFSWKKTKAGSRAKHACPYGPPNVVVERECHSVPGLGATWKKLNASLCNVSTRTLSLLRLSQETVNNSNAVEVSESLLTETKTAAKLNAYDIALATITLSAIVDSAGSLTQASDNVINVLSNILMARRETLLESQRHNRTTSSILNIIEKFAEQIPLLNGSLSLVASNIEIYIKSITTQMLKGGVSLRINSMDNTKISTNMNSVEKPSFMIVSRKAVEFASRQGSQRLTSIVYRNNKLFPVVNDIENSREPNNNQVGTVVLAGKFKDASIREVKDAVELNFVPNIEIQRGKAPSCVYWDFGNNDGFGNWSSEGCSYVETNSGYVTCRCNHMTNFAMLFTADSSKYEGNDDHRNALNVISYVGCGVSLVTAMLTLLTYTLFRYLRRSNAQLVLCHLCVALIGLLISFLVVVSRTPNTTTCRWTSIVVHYFLLVTFAWMGVEGINMYLALVKIMSAHVPRFMSKAIAFAWGTPLVIVVITASVAFDDYSSEKSCFIHGVTFYIGVLTPCIAILLWNFVMFGLTMYSLSRMGKNVPQENRIQGYQRIKIALAIMVLLGFTWLFGVVAIGSARLVFQYIFCIFNSLQGFAIFWFHCVRQSEVRECWADLLCRYGTRKRRYTASSTVPALKKSSATSSPKISSNQRPARNSNEGQRCDIELDLNMASRA